MASSISWGRAGFRLPDDSRSRWSNPGLTPFFGALPFSNGVRFRVWAPAARDLTVVIHDGRAAGEYHAPRDPDAVFDLIVDRAAPGDRYSYRVDGGAPRPDPASRFQPDGVHGPSQVIDPSTFRWTDAHWGGRPPADRIVYELHVGTFSPEGTFAGATTRLESLRDLGVTVVELMPLADFPGSRNWGYDGVCLYAPSRAYGGPDDLRRLVDRAHHLGIAVILDVVYNHFGPEGAYMSVFNDRYFTDARSTPWGSAVNLDGPGSAMVRRFILDNAVHWIREYHLDGLRIDAVQTLLEEESGTIVRTIAEDVRSGSARQIFVHAEDDRNYASIVEDAAQGGWGLDGVWADDFHHIVRRLLAGDSFGYYADFQGTTAELAKTLCRGWLFEGQKSDRHAAGRGSDPSRVPMYRFIVCLQNHDQVGNRAMGDRLNTAIPIESWRAASTLLLTAPMTPLLFMGQEWGARTPFCYFTDLEPSLGERVTAGRRREFAEFPEFSDEQAQLAIPDPQSVETFERSRLNWTERDQPAHRAVRELYRALIALRLDNPALSASADLSGCAFAVDEDTIALRRADGAAVFCVIVRFRSAGEVGLDSIGEFGLDSGSEWEVVLTTEEPLFALDPRPPEIDTSGPPIVHFKRPGGVILRKR
jgi:maltooligosyltrehalose trehalohydrolase